MRAAFYTLGCKVNQYETQIMQNQFAANGFDTVDFSNSADVYVINSCTVTEHGDKKTKQIIRRIRSSEPNAVIALTGCFPQAFPEQAEAIAEADVIQGASNRAALLGNVLTFIKTGRKIIDILPHKNDEKFEDMRASSFDEHTRAFVKIEDGCDRYCSYCIIPKARGIIRSKPLESLKSELSDLARNGYKEVVLVGINLSSYGKEQSYKIRLIDAVTAACGTKGIERVRLGSLEPELLTTDDLEKMAALPQFCPQFHLSLQSGCDETLKRMNRRYTSAEYMKIVDNIRKIFNNAAITTDIMVGFAGETDEEFKQSKEFLLKVGFARAHIFPYSIRRGTRAADFPNQLSQTVKSERASEMADAAAQSQQRFLLSQLGKSCNVLIEQPTGNGYYSGYTENYTKVLIKTDAENCGKIVSAKLITAADGCCVGEITAR